MVAWAELDCEGTPVLLGDPDILLVCATDPVCPHSEGLIIDDPDTVLVADTVFVLLADMLETGLEVGVFRVFILLVGSTVSETDGLFVDVILTNPELVAVVIVEGLTEGSAD